MDAMGEFFQGFLPAGFFYLATAIVLIMGLVKCCRPVFLNAASLKHGAHVLQEGARARLARPVWNEPGFLGKRLVPVWRDFLQSADLMGLRGAVCDVADYVNEDSIIQEPGRQTLSDMIPGLCTSLGILGTFVGLSIGLSGLDVMEVNSYAQLTGGIALAFNTSIVGLAASLLYNIVSRMAAGRARTAITSYNAAFYAYAIAKPADSNAQLIAYEREQADAMVQFSEGIAHSLSGEIRNAISQAMHPMTEGLDKYLAVASQTQVAGLERIVDRFTTRMDQSLAGQYSRLGQALTAAATAQEVSHHELTSTLDAIQALAHSQTNIEAATRATVTSYTAMVQQMEKSVQSLNDNQAEAMTLLDELNGANLKQARYMASLQEYQAKLQSAFQDYTIWTDRIITGLNERADQQNQTLSVIEGDMRVSGETLRGAYKSFVESIEVGLSNALGLFDENMQSLTRQIHATLSEIQTTMSQLERAIIRASNSAGVRRD